MTTTTPRQIGVTVNPDGAPPAPEQPEPKPVGEQSVGELVATVTRTMSLLVHQEVEQAKADLTASAKRGAIGAAAFIAAGLIAFFAAIFLSLAAALGIHALGISLGFSFLIIGGAWLVLVLVAAGAGIISLKGAAPKRNPMESLKADVAALKRSKNGKSADEPAKGADDGPIRVGP